MPTRRRLLLTVSAALAASALPVWAQGQGQGQGQGQAQAPVEVEAELPKARLQGQGQMRFLGMHIYTIRLWTAEPVRGEAWAAPLALEIGYAHGLDGAEIAKRSLKEMQRVGEFTAAQGEAWLAAMREAFPDVRPGDRITGVQKPGEARFFVNGRPGKIIKDAQFAHMFFGIWLSPRTSEPALRMALLGTAP